MNMNWWHHLKTINHHKWLVMKHCFAIGLYRQGLLHDLSKYTPTEFLPGAKFYQGGKRSPNSAEREKKGYSQAWLHHKGRNKHHMEYWIDYQPGKHSTAGPFEFLVGEDSRLYRLEQNTSGNDAGSDFDAQAILSRESLSEHDAGQSSRSTSQISVPTEYFISKDGQLTRQDGKPAGYFVGAPGQTNPNDDKITGYVIGVDGYLMQPDGYPVDGAMVGCRMPVKYVLEMFCDRVAACKNYNGSAYTDADAYEYFMRGKSHYIIHPESGELLEKLLLMLKERGEEETFRYIRVEILHKKK